MPVAFWSGPKKARAVNQPWQPFSRLRDWSRAGTLGRHCGISVLRPANPELTQIGRDPAVAISKHNVTSGAFAAGGASRC